jgi:hypothetical protein
MAGETAFIVIFRILADWFVRTVTTDTTDPPIVGVTRAVKDPIRLESDVESAIL